MADADAALCYSIAFLQLTSVLTEVRKFDYWVTDIKLSVLDHTCCLREKDIDVDLLFIIMCSKYNVK